MAVRNTARNLARKRQNTRTTALIACGCLAIALAALLRPGKSEAVKTEITPVVGGEFDTVSLPVPASFVPAGTRTKDIQFNQISFPKHQVPAGALTSVNAVLEGVTIAALPARLPLFRENFSLTAGASNPVLERIPQGMRAMTVRVDATSAVEGWAGSGSIVDVLLVEKDRTTLVAEKVKVLSAERSVSPVEGSAAPSVPSTVTILVSPEQCMAINTAIPRGRLAFALRSSSDEAAWGEAVYTADRLKGGRVSTESRQSISGYVSVKGHEKQDAYALADGKWIRTQVKPEGFFVAGER